MRAIALALFAMVAFLAASSLANAQSGSQPQMSAAEFQEKLRYAQVYEENRDATNAARVYAELFAVDPSDANVFDGYIRALIALRRYDVAETIVNQRLKTDHSLNVILLSARLEAWMDKRQQALATFQSAENSVNARDCSSLFPIVYAMMDVSYNQDALDLLDRMRQQSVNDMDICSSEIAGLYLRLGDFNRASKEFISILKSGEGNVGMVEQRLAEYITDSLSRLSVLGPLEQELLTATSDKSAANSPQSAPGIRADLRLLAWLYGEKRNYSEALNTILRLDDLEKVHQWGEGAELLQFAERARSEGALNVAARAYTEASRRLGTASGEAYYAADAQLGALKTWEAYFDSRSVSDNDSLLQDSISNLVREYERFASQSQESDFALNALVHAATLAYHRLHDVDRATKDFETALNRAPAGLTDPVQKAAFGLVDLAYASENFPLAQQRMSQIAKMLREYHTANPRDILDHLLYEQGLGEYYQAHFDTALILLDSVSNDAASDYANDAISLEGIIQESNTPFYRSSLTLFAKGALDEQAHRWKNAEAAYRAIIDSETNPPLADDAVLRSATALVELNRPADALAELDSMQMKMLTSPLLDQAAFREAEITERNLHDNARAEKLYQDFLERYPNSTYVDEARDRARKLRGDAF